MQQDACTKAIFREMDGFLSLMSVLAALSISVDGSTPEEVGQVPMTPVPALVEPPSQLEEDRKECLKLTFIVLSEAMEGEEDSEAFFRVGLILSSILINTSDQARID